MLLTRTFRLTPVPGWSCSGSAWVWKGWSEEVPGSVTVSLPQAGNTQGELIGDRLRFQHVLHDPGGHRDFPDFPEHRVAVPGADVETVSGGELLVVLLGEAVALHCDGRREQIP